METCHQDLGGVLPSIPDILKHTKFFLRLLVYHATELSVQNMKIKTAHCLRNTIPNLSSGQDGRQHLHVPGASHSHMPGRLPSHILVYMCLFQNLETFIHMTKHVSSHLLCNYPLCSGKIPNWGDSSHDVLPGTQKTRTFSNSISRHFKKHYIFMNTTARLHETKQNS